MDSSGSMGHARSQQDSAVALSRAMTLNRDSDFRLITSPAYSLRRPWNCLRSAGFFRGPPHRRSIYSLHSLRSSRRVSTSKIGCLGFPHPNPRRHPHPHLSRTCRPPCAPCAPVPPVPARAASLSILTRSRIPSSFRARVGVGVAGPFTRFGRHEAGDDAERPKLRFHMRAQIRSGSWDRRSRPGTSAPRADSAMIVCASRTPWPFQ